MSEDNGLSLRNRVVPRPLGNDQSSSVGHADEPPPTLVPETSASLSELFEQMARMLESFERTQLSLERSSQAQDARLDSILAAVSASNENMARIGQVLARNGSYNGGFASTLPHLLPMQSISMVSAMPTVVATYQVVPPLGSVQPQTILYQAGVRPMGQNIGHQPENYWGTHLPPPLPVFQPQAGDRNGGQIPAQGPP